MTSTTFAEALKREVLKQSEAESSSAIKGGDPASRRLLLLLHGEKANDDLVRDAVSRLRREGHQVTVRVTFESGDVDRLVKEALTLKSADTLVAAGGDGTVCEVVDAVLKHTGGIPDTRSVSDPQDPLVRAHGHPPSADTVSVAILPLGTSNDFAATTGLPEDPYDALLLATRRDSIKKIDVGLLNGKVFMNTATIGASAEVGKITSSNLKRILGPFAFIFTGLRVVNRWHPVSSVLCFPNIKEHGAYKEQKKAPTDKGESLASALSQELPAEEVHVAKGKGGVVTEAPSGPSTTASSPTTTTAATTPGASPALKTAAQETGSEVAELQGVPLLHLTAANNRQIASMVSVAPDAVLDDGMLDCIYLTGGAVEQAGRVLKDLLLKGAHRTKAVSTMLRVPWLEIASSEPLEWSLDGDPQDQPTNRFRFSLLHRAIQIHLPDDRMLVAGQPAPVPEDEELAAKRKGKGNGLSNPLRLPRGRLRPPSLAAMLGRVTRFRKKRNWGAILRSLASGSLKALLFASLGGALVYYLHTHDRLPALSTPGSKTPRTKLATGATVDQELTVTRGGGGRAGSGESSWRLRWPKLRRTKESAAVATV